MFNTFFTSFFMNKVNYKMRGKDRERGKESGVVEEQVMLLKEVRCFQIGRDRLDALYSWIQICVICGVTNLTPSMVKCALSCQEICTTQNRHRG